MHIGAHSICCCFLSGMSPVLGEYHATWFWDKVQTCVTHDPLARVVWANLLPVAYCMTTMFHGSPGIEREVDAVQQNTCQFCLMITEVLYNQWFSDSSTLNINMSLEFPTANGSIFSRNSERCCSVHLIALSNLFKQSGCQHLLFSINQ